MVALYTSNLLAAPIKALVEIRNFVTNITHFCDGNYTGILPSKQKKRNFDYSVSTYLKTIRSEASFQRYKQIR